MKNFKELMNAETFCLTGFYHNYVIKFERDGFDKGMNFCGTVTQYGGRTEFKQGYQSARLNIEKITPMYISAYTFILGKSFKIIIRFSDIEFFTLNEKQQFITSK